MIERILTTKLIQLSKQFPAISILGPRQVGKTTLAKAIQRVLAKEALYLDLELPADINKLTDPVLYFNLHQDQCIILDEIQRMPHLFPILRAVIDQHRVPGRFILLGSASPDLLKESAETLAGRIVYTELTPLNLLEVKEHLPMYTRWLRGGFPEPLLALEPTAVATWHRAFITTYLERELPNLGLQTDTVTLFRFFSMLVHQQGSIWNTSYYAKSLGIGRRTIEQYLDYVEKAYLIRRLPAFYTNAKKRLVKSPKVYVRDSGMVHYLIGLTSMDQLLGHGVVGTSWEGFVLEQIISVTQNQYGYYYYRTQDQTECDLVLVKGGLPIAGIAAKLSAAPKQTKSFTNSIQDLGTKYNYIITPKCEQVYPLSDRIMVCGLLNFLENHLPQLADWLPTYHS